MPLETLLAKMTHLKLNEKGLTKIANLRQCTGISVLYLYDNRIRKLENLEFATDVTHLYLQVWPVRKVAFGVSQMLEVSLTDWWMEPTTLKT